MRMKRKLGWLLVVALLLPGAVAFAAETETYTYYCMGTAGVYRESISYGGTVDTSALDAADPDRLISVYCPAIVDDTRSFWLELDTDELGPEFYAGQPLKVVLAERVEDREAGTIGLYTPVSVEFFGRHLYSEVTDFGEAYVAFGEQRLALTPDSVIPYPLTTGQTFEAIFNEAGEVLVISIANG